MPRLRIVGFILERKEILFPGLRHSAKTAQCRTVIIMRFGVIGLISQRFCVIIAYLDGIRF